MYKKASKYVSEWNKLDPPGYGMTAFTEWFFRQFNYRPTGNEVDYVKAYAKGYPFQT